MTPLSDFGIPKAASCRRTPKRLRRGKADRLWSAPMFLKLGDFPDFLGHVRSSELRKPGLRSWARWGSVVAGGLIAAGKHAAGGGDVAPPRAPDVGGEVMFKQNLLEYQHTLFAWSL